MTLHRTLANSISGWARGRLHDPAAGAADIRQALAALVERGDMAEAAYYTGLLAQLEAEAVGIELLASMRLWLLLIKARLVSV